MNDTLNSVVGSSADFSGPVSDIPIVQHKIAREDSSGVLQDLTSKDDRVSSALQRIQELC